MPGATVPTRRGRRWSVVTVRDILRNRTYTGTYAQLGTAITNGFKLAVSQAGGKLGGREIEFVKVDDESEPSKATDNVNKLIKRDNVDVIVGTVHSGVAMAMAKAAKDSGTTLSTTVTIPEDGTLKVDFL